MEHIRLKEIATVLETDEVRDLLLQLEYPQEIRERKTEQIILGYRQNPEWPLLGLKKDGVLVGLIGLALGNIDSAVIQHIVVRRDYRRCGIGRRMIRAVIHRFSLREISAETDKDAVDFYRKCGFSIKSLGEKYPGTERFWCTLGENTN
jgi:ribosomal protein S18 acetylase RimI-like enzyme